MFMCSKRAIDNAVPVLSQHIPHVVKVLYINSKLAKTIRTYIIRAHDMPNQLDEKVFPQSNLQVFGCQYTVQTVLSVLTARSANIG